MTRRCGHRRCRVEVWKISWPHNTEYELQVIATEYWVVGRYTTTGLGNHGRWRMLHRLRVEEIRQGFPAPTMVYKTVVFEKSADARPGPEELFECTVMDFGTRKVKGE